MWSQEKAIVMFLKENPEGLSSRDGFMGRVKDEDGSPIVITRLSGRIYNIRKDGYKIINVKKESVNPRNGRKSHYVVYRLVENEDEKTKFHVYG